MDPWRVVIVARIMASIPVLRHLCVHALLLDAADVRRRLRGHGSAGRGAGIGPGARPQEPLLRRREDPVRVAVVHVLAVRLDFQAFRGCERRRRRERLQVCKGSEGSRTEGEPRVQELRLKVVQDVRREASVGLHVPQSEAGGERPVQFLRGLTHLELDSSFC